MSKHNHNIFSPPVKVSLTNIAQLVFIFLLITKWRNPLLTQFPRNVIGYICKYQHSALNPRFGIDIVIRLILVFYFHCHWESYEANLTNKFKMSVCLVSARSFAKKKNLHEYLVCFEARNLSVMIKSLFLENISDSPNMFMN